MESLNNIDTFFERLHKVYNDKLPFVVYRKPNETRISLICQKTADLYKLKSFDEKGFIFSPLLVVRVLQEDEAERNKTNKKITWVGLFIMSFMLFSYGFKNNN